MCGIAALLRLGDRPLVEPKRTLAKMLRAIAHRGPDDAGVFVDDNCALGAVRLAVVDARGGKQPALGCAGSGVACVYNGELYDFAALRSSLIARGHRVEDRCDTSLLPHLYEDAGGDVASMVAGMHGMFAFAVWDARRRRLVLGRDRFGIKPLFYAVGDGFLVVASEAKAIFASGLVDAELDSDSVEDLFTLGYPCPPRSMFRGVRSLPPGHVATLALTDATAPPDAAAPPREPRIHIERYWRAPIPHAGEHDSRSLRAVAGDLRDALASAVKSHLAADVPVASSLSGGLDSSLIAALAKSATTARSSTFSLTFPEPFAQSAGFDESRSIDDVTHSLDVDAHKVEMRARESAALLASMVWHTELPLLVPGAIGGLLLAQAMRNSGVAVALTGDGADELLGGYDVFRLAKARRTLGKAFSRSAASIVAKPKGIAKLFRKNRDVDATEQSFGVDPPWFEQWRLVASANVIRGRGVDEPPPGWSTLVRDDIAELDPLDRQIAIEIETRLPSWILVISDRSHMAYGVEARVPYLDDDVAKLALSVAPNQKMRLLREKAVLREAARGLVPDSIRRRRKQPFMTPVAAWFDFAELSEPDLDKTGMFDADAVFALRRELRSSRLESVERMRAELVLMLVLQTQLLARAFRDPPKPLFPSTHRALELLESTS